MSSLDRGNAFTRERFFVRRLIQLKLTTLDEIHQGATSFDIRRDRIRDVILRNHLATDLFGSSVEPSLTFAAAFERGYRMPLIPISETRGVPGDADTEGRM